ncbi:MAG: RdgB/HAM1 family non-canonical purine NTP pyrophosphatase [Clostridiales Family XIII bacterium]|jgi:XTP/dITP diphosphohydrolase|nr:RdgB/HAM1 family non-canonical purine NTP pyrophosphatase [Clostridiales Family XIII bacterium]
MDEKKAVFIAATGNKHKMGEMRAILKAFGVDLVSKDEISLADCDPEETGATFEENAYIKAKAVLDRAGRPVVADDSGLEVDALDGAPGVRSARFAGSATDAEGAERDAANNAKLLRLMEGVPDDARTARFVSVITVLWPDGGSVVARGECEGRILREAKGTNGFGYDPLFVPEGEGTDGRTFAGLSSDEKNRVSHRARALAELGKKLAATKNHGEEQGRQGE